MKILTNEGNPLGLKLILLAKFAQREIQVELVNPNEVAAKDYLTLPAVELENGLQLFSTNAVAKYLFPDEGQERDEWLEWSMTMLAPALVHHLAAGQRVDANALPMLNALINKLEQRLSITNYLIGNKLTSADIAIWSLLAPDGTLKGVENIEHLLVWYQKVAALPEVEAALAIQPLKSLTFSSIQNSNRYGGLHHIPLLPAATTAANVTPTNIEICSSQLDSVTEMELETARAAFVAVAALPERKEPRIVLPRAGERNVLVTSALPYVNNVPHLGNIIGCVLSADIYARYARSVGYNTLFICGTDEYGTATENKAMAENLSPKEICDKYFELHNSIYCWFGIGFDYFGRTTTQEQTEIVQEAFRHVNDAGYILKESVEQLLCQKCDRFLADRFVEGTCPHPGCGYEDARGDQCDKCGKLINATELIRPRCQVCNTAPVVRSSDQLFLDLPKVEPQLRQWVEKAEHGWTNNARVITRSWLREGLKPRCITRDLKWGIPVNHPGFERKVFYVWFDAPFGYISITKRYTKDYQQWWQPSDNVNVELFQFMAKDNVPFHSVMWPASLLAINRGHLLPAHIMATEYLNYEDGKFSKSRGNGVFGNDAQETGIAADVWRFYLASARPEGQDSSFSWNDLAARNNSELLNNLGNFVNRALVFCEKNFQSIVPPIVLTDDELTLLALINRELRGYLGALEKAKLRDGIRHLLGISRHGNGYMQAQQPWVLLKDAAAAEKQARAATIIGVCCNIATLLANLIFPYMPATARTMFAQLNTKQTLLKADQPFMTLLLPAGHKIGKPAPLFAKLEQPFIDELKRKYAGVPLSSTVDCTKDEIGGSSEVMMAQLELAVQRQGEKVRQLKANTKDKSVWQPEVNILLDLKKQLENCQKIGTKKTQNGIETVPSNVEVDAIKLQALESQIAKQAEHVRVLKTTTDPSVWKPEVDILLALKKQLTALNGTPAATAIVGTQSKNKKKK